MPFGRVIQPAALLETDANGARLAAARNRIEQDAGHEDIRLDNQTVGMPGLYLEEEIARTRPASAHHKRRFAVLMHRDIRPADRHRHRDDAFRTFGLCLSVVRIEGVEASALDESVNEGPGAVEAHAPGLLQRAKEHGLQPAIRESKREVGKARVQPPVESMLAA